MEVQTRYSATHLWFFKTLLIFARKRISKLLHHGKLYHRQIDKSQNILTPEKKSIIIEIFVLSYIVIATAISKYVNSKPISVGLFVLTSETLTQCLNLQSHYFESLLVKKKCLEIRLTNAVRSLLQHNSCKVQASRWSALQLKIMLDVTETSVAHQGGIKEL